MISLSQRSIRKIENWLIVPFAVVVGLGIAYWAMVIDRTPPIVLTEGEVMPNAARRLEPVTARWVMKKTRAGSYDQSCTREIIDSLGTFHRVDEHDRSGVTAPMENYIARSVNVPIAASWGRAHYRVQCCYEMDGLSLTRIFPVCVRRPELPFEILPNK